MKAYCKDCKGWVEITDRFAPIQQLNKSINLKQLRTMFLVAHKRHVHTNYDILRKELTYLLKSTGLKRQYSKSLSCRFINALLLLNSEYEDGYFLGIVQN